MARHHAAGQLFRAGPRHRLGSDCTDIRPAAQYRELLARLGRWRVAPRWYDVALLLNPLTLLLVLGALSLKSPAYIPGLKSPAYIPGLVTNDLPLECAMRVAPFNPLLIVGLAFAVGLASGLFEEVGWTGFAKPPRLLARHARPAAGLGLGVVWATWQIGPDVPGSAAGDNRPFGILGRTSCHSARGRSAHDIVARWAADRPGTPRAMQLAVGPCCLRLPIS